MTSRHLINPQLLPLLDTWPTIAITPDNLPGRRERQLPNPVVRDESVSLEIMSVPGPAGSPPISLHLYRPAGVSQILPTIYHIHGGGYISGSPSQLEAVHRPLVKELGCALVSVDYRLAPETIFPGAIEDCYAGLSWLFAHSVDLGIDVERLGVMGESAGGGLAAALAMMARDRGQFPIRFQHLVYPMLDDRTCVRVDPHPYTGEFLWHAPNNLFAWRAMLGQDPGGDNVSAYAAPARATSLAGLPPAFLSVGALDLFLEETLEYGRLLSRAGVAVELHVWPGAIHGFDFLPDADVAKTARAASWAALKRALCLTD